MKSDSKIQQDVLQELKWQPSLNPAEIGVSVNNGVVTLSGQVDSYLKKITAEKVTKKVAGVKAVAEDIHVGISPGYSRTDTEIATSALQALKAHSAIREEEVKIRVEDGIVQLEGQVEWSFQRNNVQRAIENLYGVKNVLNNITLKPKATSSEITKQISDALKRSAVLDAGNIAVEVKGGIVKLTGKVRSLAEKTDAENAAWNATGITSVDSKLEIEEPYISYVD